MTPYYQDEAVVIYHGDCREILPLLEPVDLVLTDPPYGVDMAYGDESIDSLEETKKLYSTILPLCILKSSITITTVGCFAIRKNGVLWSSMP